jgi:hypothetical protein
LSAREGIIGGSPAITASATAQHATLLAKGPTELSVVDSGVTPPRGMRFWVGLNPTMPQSAAGIRIEPPVSVPIATTAPPSLTDTAAPDEDPPGNQLPIVRISRGAVMRIDADAGEDKLGHIRAADQDGAGRAKARNDWRVTLRRRAVVQSLRSGQDSLARYVEEVLQGNRQSGEWGGDGPGLAQPILRNGCRTRILGIDLDEGTRAFGSGIGDLRACRFDQLTAGRAPIREICSDF